jgi:DNA-binding NarL/FixJ family response regulator
MHVVATVGNGENILLIMGKVKPNIVLLDLGLRNQNSIQIAKHAHLSYSYKTGMENTSLISE